MQTPFSQHPYAPELFTRERRRTRVRQFLDSFEKGTWTGIVHVPKLLPIKVSAPHSKQEEWLNQASR
jgi:hypothetical protein